MENYKVFIGAEAGEWLPSEVLKYSIRKRTSLSIDFQETRFFPQSQKVRKIKGASLDRFWIPEVCEYKGRVVYLDPASIVLGDIQELFQISMQDKGALALPLDTQKQAFLTNVMVLDCAKLTNWKEADWADEVTSQPQKYHQLYWVYPESPIYSQFGELSKDWHEMDQITATTKLMRYTNEQFFPWRNPGHPLRHLFIEELKSAFKEGAIPRDAIEREIYWKQAYPRLLDEIQ